jgi:hypothetical protein
MSTIYSVLVKTCMGNIQKEISQLENWLQSLPPSEYSSNKCLGQSSPSVQYPSDVDTKLDKLIELLKTTSNLKEINSSSNELLELVKKQNDEISTLKVRISILESMREVHISNPWIDDDTTPLHNEIVNLCDSVSDSESCTFSEVIYQIHKKADDTDDTDKSSVMTPEIVPNIPDDKSAVPDIIDVEGYEEEEQEQEEEQEEEEAEEEQEEEQEEEEEEAEEEQEEEQEEEEEEAEKQEEEEEAEEEQEEEQDELEEIEYKGITYYKDGEGFIYSMTDEELSENPVGYWKEKTQTVAFYKTK